MSQVRQLGPLYNFWNNKVNVISRQDIVNLYEHHVLHSLAIGKFIDFQPGTKVMDLGTGGGFPGIPLAILFPDVHFHLVDSIGKKVAVAEAVAKAMGLKNVTVECARAEAHQQQYDFVVSRAVADMMIIYGWVINNIKRGTSFNDVPNGLICLKGGNLDMELAPFKDLIYKFQIRDLINEVWFSDKYVVYLPME
ncbi:MAG: 16S rRNA (guanine(527)-N(7))-methyltransferase RsmG [Sphingobacteriales bacterium BACL12 MAG-120802-bin5]|nr:MAG: 16S rRNA (guanine(527)-N(7))-methyltransferase RsmG [Sphingobacteriales bacterium BACL12 MAG-120802-bin5]